MTPEFTSYLTRGEREGARYVFQIPREALQGQAGYRLSNRAGSSIEFKDFRDYQAGDDLRRVDWSVYARSDRMIVKMFHDEVNPHVDLLLDLSASMNLPETPKVEAVLGVTALLAAAADNGRCTRRIWTVTDRVEELPNSGGPPSTWQNLAFGSTRDVPTLLTRYGRNSVRVLISDLMWDADPRDILRPLVAGAARVVVIQLLTREEEAPEVTGQTKLVDQETGGVMELVLDAMTAQRYREALARHRAQWQAACQSYGALMITDTAERLLETWRLDGLESANVLGVA